MTTQENDAQDMDDALRQPLELITHIMFGLMLGFAAYVSVTSRSLNFALGVLTLAGFCLVPAIASWLRKQQRWAAGRSLGLVMNLGWLAVILYYMVLFADHLYMVNASSYPRFLAATVTTTPERIGFVGGSESLCADHGFGQYFFKDNGVFLRCGAMSSSPKTFYIENYEQAYEAWKKLEDKQ